MTSGPPKRSIAAAFIVSGMDGFMVGSDPRAVRDRIWTWLAVRPGGPRGFASGLVLGAHQHRCPQDSSAGSRFLASELRRQWRVADVLGRTRWNGSRSARSDP